MFCLDLQFVLQFVLVCFPAQTFKEMIHLKIQIYYLLTHAIPNQCDSTKLKISYEIFWGNKSQVVFVQIMKYVGPKQCQSLLILTEWQKERKN